MVVRNSGVGGGTRKRKHTRRGATVASLKGFGEGRWWRRRVRARQVVSGGRREDRQVWASGAEASDDGLVLATATGFKERRAVVSQGEGVQGSAWMGKHTRRGPSGALGRNCGGRNMRGIEIGEGCKGRRQTHLKKRKEQDGRGGA